MLFERQWEFTNWDEIIVYPIINLVMYEMGPCVYLNYGIIPISSTELENLLKRINYID